MESNFVHMNFAFLGQGSITLKLCLIKDKRSIVLTSACWSEKIALPYPLRSLLSKILAPFLGSGDEVRNWVPPSINGQSCYYLCANRNKKSIALNLAHPEGQALVKLQTIDLPLFLGQKTVHQSGCTIREL